MAKKAKEKLIGVVSVSGDGRTVEINLGSYGLPCTLVFRVMDPVTSSAIVRRHVRVSTLKKYHGLKIMSVGPDDISLEIDA